MTKQTETKTPTQKLRAELKAAGFKPSAISVRKSSGGAIYVYIKDRGIALEAVEEIANGLQRDPPMRCERRDLERG